MRVLHVADAALPAGAQQQAEACTCVMISRAVREAVVPTCGRSEVAALEK